MRNIRCSQTWKSVSFPLNQHEAKADGTDFKWEHHTSHVLLTVSSFSEFHLCKTLWFKIRSGMGGVGVGCREFLRHSAMFSDQESSCVFYTQTGFGLRDSIPRDSIPRPFPKCSSFSRVMRFPFLLIIPSNLRVAEVSKVWLAGHLQPAKHLSLALKRV